MYLLSSKISLDKAHELLVKLSKRYYRDASMRKDLIQEGWVVIFERIGAIVDMDEDQGLSYLVPFIRKAMLLYSIKNRRIVRFAKTKEDYKAICNITSLMRGRDRMDDDDAKAFSKILNVGIESVRMAYECIYEEDRQFEHENCENDIEFKSNNVIDIFSALANRKSEDAIKLEAIYMAANDLNDDQRFIFDQRWLCDKQATLKSIAATTGLSISGVAFLESKALSSMRDQVSGFY